MVILQRKPSKETQFAGEVAKEIVGEQNVDINAKPIMASEDFSYMIEERPGVIFTSGRVLECLSTIQNMTSMMICRLWEQAFCKIGRKVKPD